MQGAVRNSLFDSGLESSDMDPAETILEAATMKKAGSKIPNKMKKLLAKMAKKTGLVGAAGYGAYKIGDKVQEEMNSDNFVDKIMTR